MQRITFGQPEPMVRHLSIARRSAAGIALALGIASAMGADAQQADQALVYRVTIEDFECLIDASKQLREARKSLIYLDLSRCPRNPIIALGNLVSNVDPNIPVARRASDKFLVMEDTHLLCLSRQPVVALGAVIDIMPELCSIAPAE